MEFKEKLVFGKGVWVDCKGLVPAVGKTLGRLLTQGEINILFRAINSKFREEFSAHEEQWNEWLRNNEDTEFTFFLKIHDVDVFSEHTNIKNIQVAIRKNLQPELISNSECWPYIATVVYGARRSTFGKQKSMRDFTVDGLALCYRKFAFDNLYTALEKIGKINAPEGMGWFDAVMENVWKAYAILSDDDKANKFVLGTGMSLRPDVFDEYTSRSPISILVCRLDDKCWDIQIIIANDLDNPKSIEDCIPRLYRCVDRKTLDASIRELARIADPEDWSCRHKPYGSLLYYIESVYDRLDQERAAGDQNVFAVPKDDGCAIVFCTGLVTPDVDGAHYIYAYCSSPDEDGVYHQIDWLTHLGTRKEGITYNQKLVFNNPGINHGLPYPPHWVLESERLLFDYRYGSIAERQIVFNLPHIYVNLRQRLPESAKEQFCRKFRSEFYNKSIKHDFEEYLYSAWRETRKILQKSFKVAIPTYYRSKIQLLVPLYLDEKDRDLASVALVVALNEKIGIGAEHYVCPTCLSLDMARTNSRVITRIDDTWLS